MVNKERSPQQLAPGEWILLGSLPNPPRYHRPIHVFNVTDCREIPGHIFLKSDEYKLDTVRTIESARMDTSVQDNPSMKGENGRSILASTDVEYIGTVADATEHILAVIMNESITPDEPFINRPSDFTDAEFHLLLDWLAEIHPGLDS